MRQSTLIDPEISAQISWDQLDDQAAVEAHMAKWAPRFLLTLNLDGTNDRQGPTPDFILSVGAVYGYVIIGEIRHHGVFFLEGEPGIGKTQVWQVLYEALAGEHGHGYAKQVTADFISKNGEGHRFDISMIIGKRMLFLDETMMAMSFDEARMSNLASGKTMECEIKFGRDSVKFANRAKLCISGNHRPHFISGEAGGLASRLMLFEAKGKSLRGSAIGINNVATQIVQDEGPAILMWAIQNAWLDYAAEGHTRYHRLMATAKAAAAEYTRQDSPVVQWVDDCMELSLEFDIDLVDALKDYIAYHKDFGEKRKPRPTDLKRLLLAAYKDLEWDTRKGGEHPNRVYIKGLGRKRPTEAFGNVVPFQAHAQPKPEGK